jgi:hypothetical protein
MKHPSACVGVTAFTETVEFEVVVIQFTDQNGINLWSEANIAVAVTIAD